MSSAKRLWEAIPVKVKSIALFIVVWWLLSLTMSENFLPSPWKTITAFQRMEAQEIFVNISATMVRLTLGFIFAMIIGTIVGTIMGMSKKLEDWFGIWVMIALAIPGLVYVVLSFMWFGLNEFSTVLAISLASFPSVAVNIYQGVKDVDKKLIDMAKIFGVYPKDLITKVVLPQVYPYLMASARFCLGVVWKLTAVVELLGRSNGVGYQLNYWFQMYNMGLVLGWTGLFLIIVTAIETLIILPIERKLFTWRPEIKF
ncbi:MAG: ABC transporter permease [Thermincola sp.]|jgi:NitT/TauT family transport system permease protein|nr:ABC transporter permease [Thermincola sp.]MDT3701433.1 ABC transporter permease [Thermincola sp.]